MNTIWVSLIIFVNLVIYAAWNFKLADFVTPQFLLESFTVSYQGLMEGRYWTLLTAAFSHSFLIHFIFNMLVIHSFGRVLELTLGAKKFLSLYFIAAVFSSLTHAFVSAHFLHQPAQSALGASGAASGVILLFSLLYPKERILLFGIVPIPALVGALLFIGLDVWGLFAQAGGGGLPIGHGAHLGGALIGILFYFFTPKRKVPETYYSA